MFGVQELATAVQYGINLVTIVFNKSFGNVRRDQKEGFERPADRLDRQPGLRQAGGILRRRAPR